VTPLQLLAVGPLLLPTVEIIVTKNWCSFNHVGFIDCYIFQPLVLEPVDLILVHMILMLLFV